MQTELRRPSQTAVLVAAARALHLEEPPPHVLEDTLALPLAGEDARRLVEGLHSELPREALLAFVRFICVRARVCEDAVERGVPDGLSQYVILGAGLDSLAYRRGDLLDSGLRVFEVDHPASQAWKRARLDELNVSLPASLLFAPVDFEHQTLPEGLEAAGFDAAAPALFSWMGVTMYLSMEAIRSTLSAVAAGPLGTRIVLTYNQPRSASTGIASQVEQAILPLVASMGEPVITTFTPLEIEELLRVEGFGEVTHFGPDEALQTYYRGRRDVHFAGAQRIAMGTVTRKSR